MRRRRSWPASRRRRPTWPLSGCACGRGDRAWPVARGAAGRMRTSCHAHPPASNQCVSHRTVRCPQAYCHYRQGKLQEALAALQEVPADKEAACLQLEAQVGALWVLGEAGAERRPSHAATGARRPVAPQRIDRPAAAPPPWLRHPPQIHYRLGSNKEAIALYSQLFRSHGGESREVQTNVLAAYVAGGRAADIPAVMQAMKVGRGGGGGDLAGTCAAAELCGQGDACRRAVAARSTPARAPHPLPASCLPPVPLPWPPPINRPSRFRQKTALRLRSTRRAAWWRRASWQPRSSSCSWRSAWVSGVARWRAQGGGAWRRRVRPAPGAPACAHVLCPAVPCCVQARRRCMMKTYRWDLCGEVEVALSHTEGGTAAAPHAMPCQPCCRAAAAPLLRRCCARRRIARRAAAPSRRRGMWRLSWRLSPHSWRTWPTRWAGPTRRRPRTRACCASTSTTTPPLRVRRPHAVPRCAARLGPGRAGNWPLTPHPCPTPPVHHQPRPSHHQQPVCGAAAQGGECHAAQGGGRRSEEAGCFHGAQR